MNDNNGLDILDISSRQIELLTHALKESPNQEFMDDPELGRLFKMMAILQSDVFDDLKSGKLDISKFKKN